MSTIGISVSVSLVAAVILGEVFSALWYSDGMPWGKWANRYFVAGLIADVGLAVLIQSTVARYYSVRNWEDAAMLSGWIALFYACLEAPHVVHDHRSFSRFAFHVLHKFGIMFIMAMALLIFDKY